MPNRLLDRQAELLDYLTSGAGIFGVDRGTSAARSPLGIHGGLLHLEARLSHEKRMQKIEWVLTRTLDLLGTNRSSVIIDFVEACPSTSISWLENARQFRGFLADRWRREAPTHPLLRDIAAYELAYAMARAGRTDAAAGPECALGVPPGAIRRHPGAVLLHCAYDIRPILEGRTTESGPIRRETLLAVTLPPGTDEPIVSELSCQLFALLEMLDQFADPTILQEMPGLETLIVNLAERGLVEVSQ
jgi:hypothetical protein